MKQIQKVNLIIIWIMTALIIMYNGLILKNMTYLVQATSVTVLTSIIITVIYLLPIQDLIKSYMMLTGISLSCLALSVFQGGNTMTFMTSVLVLFLATLYFNKWILFWHAATYMVACIILFTVDPVYICGLEDHTSLSSLLLIMYALLSGILFISTGIGNKLIIESNEKSRMANEQHEEILRRRNDAKDITSALKQSVGEISEKMHFLSEQADHVANSQAEIFNGSTILANSLTALSANISASSDHVVVNHQIANELSSYYQGVLNTIAQGSSQGNTLNISIDEMSKIVTDTLASIHELLKETATIHTILAELNNISKQTNLLSLNASIEAARVGFHDSGFAIVAEQIRDLSLESKTASDNMNVILADLITLIEKVSTNIEESISYVESSVIMIHKLIERFDLINESSKSSSENIAEELRLLSDIRVQFKTMDEKLQTAITMSEQNSNLITTVSDSIHNENKMIQHVTTNVDAINSVTNDINHLFDQKEEPEDLNE